MDEATITILDFADQQRGLSDLLSGIHRVPFNQSAFTEDSAPFQIPNSRQTKVCAQVLPWNPFFKRFVKDARELLGVPRGGLPAGDPQGFDDNARLGIAMDRVLVPYVWALWWSAIHNAKTRVSSTAPEVTGLPSS